MCRPAFGRMLRSMADQLTSLDASFLEIEEQDESSHMHIGWAMLFDPLPEGGAPTVERLRAQLERRLDALPRFRSRLSRQRTGGLSRPHWEPDERFDVADHIRRAVLPSPGGEQELLDWLADFWSHRLDRSRPLWELAVIEGLADGRWALVTKTHHCLVDGISAVDVTNLLLDATPEPPQPAPLDGAGPGTAPSDPPAPPQRPWLVRATGAALKLPASLAVSGTRAGASLIVHPRRGAGDVLSRTRAVAGLLVRDELIGAPATSLNVPIGGSRRFAVARADLDDMKAVKRALGGTLNDVVLAAATGALRALLESRGERLPPRGLRAMVPVSVRAAGEQAALGNRVSSLFVELPVAIGDPALRYARVMEAAESLKAGSQASGSESLVQAAGLVPPALHALAARTMFSPRLFNIAITNVPGPPRTLYAFGAPMREVLPLVPVFARHAVGIAVVSYAGGVYFGLNADAASVHDLGELSRGLEASIAELQALARVTAAARR
jgi:diacylglycerol O-acyltransferase